MVKTDQSLISAIIVGCVTGFGTLGIFFLYSKFSKVKRGKVSKENKAIASRKHLVLGLAYLVWQVIFPPFCIATGILNLEQMGIRLDTLPLGLLFALIWLPFVYLSAKPLAKWAAKEIKFSNKREIQRFWEINTIGSLDGLIAGMHWSGTVLPLLIILFGIVVPFPFSIVLAIVGRWVLHILAHFAVEAGDKMFGPKSFLLKGLFLNDFIESASFLLSGSVIAPMTFHLAGAGAKFVGCDRMMAKEAGIPWEEVESDNK